MPKPAPMHADGAMVVITLRDTPSGEVSMHSTFTPAVGQRCTPAQACALDMMRQHRTAAFVASLKDFNPQERGR